MSNVSLQITLHMFAAKTVEAEAFVDDFSGYFVLFVLLEPEIQIREAVSLGKCYLFIVFLKNASFTHFIGIKTDF